LKKFGFNKKIKLKKPMEISRLFEDGKFSFSDHLKLLWKISPSTQTSCIKIAVSVPKRYFKFSYQRNKLKRKMRESIRLNRNSISQTSMQKINLLFIYKTNSEIEFEKINNEIVFLLNLLNQKLSKKEILETDTI
jgi:ribonuclease P protein component